jgi:hypothetical protein
MQASYLYLNCPPLQFNTSEELYDLGVDIETMNSTTTDSLYMAMTIPTLSDPTGSVTFVSSCSAVRAADGSQTFAYSVCSMKQTFVDANVTCQDVDSSCIVSSVLEIPNKQPETMTDFIGEFLKSSDTGLSEFPDIGNTSYSITELYIRNKTNATEPGAGNYCDLSILDPLTFSKTLGYLMNTFYSTGFTHDFQVGSISKDTKVQLPSGTWNLTAPTVDTVHNYQDPTAPYIYEIDWIFLGIFEFCAVALLLIGLIGVLLETRTIAPDILGFASSLARNSKYIKVPKGKLDGTMGGGERVRALRDVKVMMQDIRGDEPVGKIVLGTVNAGTVRLKPDKPYI